MRSIYYGWFVLAGIFLIYVASNGILLNTLPLMYPQLIAEFGWNEEQVTRPAAIFFLATGFISAVVGPIFDRWNAKRLIIIGIVMILAALAYYPMVTALWQMTAIYLVFSIGLALGGMLASMVLLTRWFVRYRGLAVGIFLMGSSFGGAVFPLLASAPLQEGNWREAVILLTMVGGVIMLFSAFFLIRNRPEDMGLAPDGAPVQEAPKEADKPAAVALSGPTLKEAIRSPLFYLLAFSTATMWFCIVGVLQHQSLYMARDLGVDSKMLPIVFSIFFWSAIVGKLLFGFLSDHFQKGHIMLLATINLAIGLIVFRMLTPGNDVLIYTYAVIYGVGYSGAFTMIQLIIAQHFGGPSYGVILGIFVMIDTIAGFLGIMVLGIMRTQLESYYPSINMMIGLCIAATICVLVINRRGEPESRLAAGTT